MQIFIVNKFLRNDNFELCTFSYSFLPFISNEEYYISKMYVLFVLIIVLFL